MTAPSPSSPDILVTVQVRHLPEHSTPGRELFAYFITLENRSEDTWQLLARHWDIWDGRGQGYAVDGEGVVGEQPVLEPGASFDYVSGCPLTTPTGAMEGRYFMVGADGSSFPVEIPRFPLIAPAVTS